MNKQQIIELIAENKHYVSICRKIAKGTGLSEDLYQEFMLVLCEYPPEKLEGIFSRGEIKWFCVSLLYQMFFYKTTPFHRKFRGHEQKISIDKIQGFYNWYDTKYDLDGGENAGKRWLDISMIDDIVFISDQGYDFDTDVLLERIEGKIKKDLADNGDSSNWYNAKIFSLYMQEGSSRKLSKKVNIPYRSIAHTVQQYKQELRKLSDGEAA